MDRLVPGIETCQGFGLVAPPHTGGDDARRATFGAHRITEMAASVGAVGINLAGIVRQSIGTGLAVVDVGGRDGDLLDQSGIGIGTDMGLEAMNRWSALMLDPMALFVILTGRGDDRCIDKRAGLDPDRLALSWRVISPNSVLSRPWATRAFRKRTKAVRSGVGSETENPQKRRKEARSSRASASLTSDRSYQIDSSIALNNASGGQAGSPLAALEIIPRAPSIGAQSISLTSASSEEGLPRSTTKPNFS